MNKIRILTQNKKRFLEIVGAGYYSFYKDSSHHEIAYQIEAYLENDDSQIIGIYSMEEQCRKIIHDIFTNTSGMYEMPEDNNEEKIFVFDEKQTSGHLALATYVCKKNSDAVIGTLFDIAYMDEDFVGANGDEYLWKEARENGFATNCDYVIDKVSKETDFGEMIRKFVEELMSKNDYYPDYILKVKDDNDKLYISLAFNDNFGN